MTELLFELISEEIPARMQEAAATELNQHLQEQLEIARLNYTTLKTFVTPRRLIITAADLPPVQPDITVEKKGPKVGAPEHAINGFLKSAGVTLDECYKRDTSKGPVWFSTKTEMGRPTKDVLLTLLPKTLESLSWPKSMCWGSNRERWVRPIHSILCILDGDVVPLSFRGVRANNKTFGHQIMSKGAITVTNFQQYKDTLRDSYVIIDSFERQNIIRSGIENKAALKNLLVKTDNALIKENAGLVEWPIPLLGTIDLEFMEMPPEVLMSAMRKHQKYFSIIDGTGRLQPMFAMISNVKTADNGSIIVAGNERVLRARLSDAKFFWDQDLKQTLSCRAEKLQKIIFHAKLGNLQQKVERIVTLAISISKNMPDSNVKDIKTAALLCKADLSSEMVGEFPDLQGIMGSYYAQNDGEGQIVAKAIREHYSPLGPNDDCPTQPESVVLALSDKLDSLVAFFSINEKPTGSKDPYALRRAALGVIRLIIENKLRLPLHKILLKAPGSNSKLADQIIEFFADRLKVHLRGKGISHGAINAIFKYDEGNDLFRLVSRVHALNVFLKSEDGEHLVTAYKRSANILRIEEKRDNVSYDEKPDVDLFDQEQERCLHIAIQNANKATRTALKNERYEHAMEILSELRSPVDAFFDEVKVNVPKEDIRQNRLFLLSEIRNSLDQIADFSQIEG